MANWATVGQTFGAKLSFKNRIRALFGFPVYYRFSAYVSPPGTSVSANLTAIEVSEGEPYSSPYFTAVKHDSSTPGPGSAPAEPRCTP